MGLLYETGINLSDFQATGSDTDETPPGGDANIKVCIEIESVKSRHPNESSQLDHVTTDRSAHRTY